MKIVVAWSGGKDSQASLIWAVKKWGKDKIEAVFCDTGWEDDLTYTHVEWVCQQMQVKLITVKSSKYEGMEDMVIKKGRAPSTKARFCTEELKTKPMIDYILQQKEHLIIIQGIRNDESESRRLMEEQCRYFRYYFEPYTNNRMKLNILTKQIEKRVKNGKKPTKKQESDSDKLKIRIQGGFLDAKYHSYRKKEIIEWISKYSDDIFRPFLKSTALEVIQYSLDNGLKLNPLYYLGVSRVGCAPCIMCQLSEIKKMGGGITAPN